MASPSRTTTPELFAPLHVIGVDTPIGRVFLESDGQLITRVSFETLTGSRAKQPALLGTAAKQVEQYFKGKRKAFELPLQRMGTRFQQLVWAAIDDIPHGSTVSFQAIGERIGGRAMGRTVGLACSSNPMPLLIPCHRVIAMDGLLSGYVGELWRKKWLLEHEGALPKELFADAGR